MTDRQTRNSSPTLTTIFWRDIPAQVRARAGRERASAMLPPRFMVAVDAAATRAGKTAHDDYIAEWREETSNCDVDLQAEVEKRVADVDGTYTSTLLKEIVKNEGFARPGS